MRLIIRLQLPGIRSARRPGIRILFLLIPLIIAALACNASKYRTTDPDEPVVTLEEITEETGMTLVEALTIPAEDQRDRVLELMGPPDTFRLTFQELEGVVVRWEEWAYYDLGARFDFVDGQLLWTVELAAIPDLAIYAHFYDPRDFTAYSSQEEVRTLLSDQDLVEMDLTEDDVPGGLFMAADQLLLGFDQDRLVYAESLYLTPEVTQ